MHVRHSVDMYVAQKDWNQDANGGAAEFRSSYGPNYKERNAYLRELMLWSLFDKMWIIWFS